MVWKRRAGSLRRQRATILSSSLGVPSGRAGGSRCKIAASVRAWLSRRKGRRPVSISYSNDPKLKMSLRASTFFPSACSGDM